MDSTILSLLVVSFIAAAAAVLTVLVGRTVMIPLVAFEIILGIIAGPSLLGWVQHTEFLEILSEIGLAVLFFMAGNEIDFRSIRGRPLRRAAIGWLISLALGFAFALLISGDIIAAVFISIALSSTALGTILPVLRDAKELGTPFGKAVTAIGAVGEFGPLIAISLFLSGRSPGPAAIVLLIFAVLAGVSIWIALRGNHSGLHGLITATLHTSGQFAVRFILFIIIALVAVSAVLGLDILLGAFAAGVLWRIIVSSADAHDRETVEIKLDSIAFGFLVPVFFIYTGVTFELDALLSDRAALLLVPVFVLLLLVVRGLPGLLAAPKGAGVAEKGAIVFFGATALPIIVAVTAIGQESGLLSTGIASALVGAGMISVLLFPAIALVLRERSAKAPAATR